MRPSWLNSKPLMQGTAFYACVLTLPQRTHNKDRGTEDLDLNTSAAESPVPGQCSTPGASSTVLNATLDTVSWGYYYKALTPPAVVSSGDEIDVEFLSHEGGNACESGPRSAAPLHDSCGAYHSAVAEHTPRVPCQTCTY